MGDNADLSRDSRDYGPVPLSLVRGTLWARVRLAQLPSITTHVRTGLSLQPRDHLPETLQPSFSTRQVYCNPYSLEKFNE